MVIRKISIGPDLLNAMNFVVGQSIMNGKHTIENIMASDDGHINIWLSNSSNEVYLWKTVNKYTPFTLEYNIEY